MGDLAFVYSDLLMRGAPPAATELFTELRVELNIGQYLDLDRDGGVAPDVETARRIARYKSGKYTVERPLHLGAALAGRLDTSERASPFGLAVGEAFQARDDILGVFGDPAVTGKPVGDDLREGKTTPLLANAAARARGAEPTAPGAGREPRPHPGRSGLSPGVPDASGARKETEAQIEQLVAEAIESLHDLDLTTEARDALEALALYVGRRNR